MILSEEVEVVEVAGDSEADDAQWIALQICDSSFPGGSFAHSLGLSSSSSSSSSIPVERTEPEIAINRTGKKAQACADFQFI